MKQSKIHPAKYRKAVISPKAKLFNRVKIYNTLSGKKEIIKPLKGKNINIFVCGPTVYDHSHIGHAINFIFFDCFVKYLRFCGFKVFYLQNITDIDDRIIIRAKEKGVLAKNLAKAFTVEHFKKMKLLGINSVNKYAKATNYIKEIINQVIRLEKKGYAYRLNDGIYFDISKFKNYGKLSHRTILQAEDSVSRIDYSRNKKNRGDFCLWKFHAEGEPSWPAPFGKGRPGWHIEDTAITEKFFGPQYDIHGGGIDLIFPHHEAEITQMESISGKKPLVKYWMHSGFLTINGQKMSKSLNNFITINDFLKNHQYRNLRFWIAKSLWRSPVDYSEMVMVEIKYNLEKIEELLRRIKMQITKNKGLVEKSKNNLLKKHRDDFYKNLNDDFNTPKAFAVIFELIKKTNALIDKNKVSKKELDEIYDFLKEINLIFDIIDFDKLKKSNIPNEVEQLLGKRENYRKSQDWSRADEMRLEIEKYGYLVEDTKEGSILKKNY